MSKYRVVKRIADKTYTSYDYTYDGAFPPRVKGKDKRTRQKLMRRILNREVQGGKDEKEQV